LAALGAVAGWADGGAGARVRTIGAIVMVGCVLVALAQSGVRRGAGVRGHRATRERRRARVAAMTGDGVDGPDPAVDERALREFDPRLDLLAPVAGAVAIAGAAAAVGGDYPLSLFRLVVGALFLGAVTDAMLLGHWYLVQPGLGRDPIKELVRWVGALWPFEVVAWLIPTGMISVLNGTIDDGYGGIVGWMWVVACATTIGLVIAAWYALKERSYSAVMATTGLLYLAILTGFGMDLLPRALLS